MCYRQINFTDLTDAILAGISIRAISEGTLVQQLMQQTLEFMTGFVFKKNSLIYGQSIIARFSNRSWWTIESNGTYSSTNNGALCFRNCDISISINADTELLTGVDQSINFDS